MKIENIHLKNFKRFTDFKITNIPKNAKLIVLIGPNGCGKSSLFEAFLQKKNFKNLNQYLNSDQVKYFFKTKKQIDSPRYTTSDVENNCMTITTHNESDSKNINLEDKLYIRSAYRNESQFYVTSISKHSVEKDDILSKMIDNNPTVSKNYQKMVINILEKIFTKEDDELTKKAFREKLLKELQDILNTIFNDPLLNLDNLGNVLKDETFKFSKGSSKSFTYENLSGGEKAVFDLILDLFINKSKITDGIYCIDEPELHINSKLQRKLLSEIYKLIPDNSQLWIATHSLGMMREAYNMYKKNNNDVVFLDFSNKDFDKQVQIQPTIPDRNFWLQVNKILLDDIADLVAPENIIFCEGKEDQTSDAACYNQIFSKNYPNFQFVSMGSCSEVKKEIVVLKYVIKSNIYRLIDRDSNSDTEIQNNKKKEIITLKKRNIESYLWDDEILRKLCEKHNKKNLINKIIKEKTAKLKEKNTEDDLKKITGSIYNLIKNELKLNNCGNTPSAFMRDALAPLCTEETKIYKKLQTDIFDEIKSLQNNKNS